MFKFFYKTFLISLVSMSLTAFDFSVAYAAASAAATGAQSSNMSRDSNGVVSRTETHRTNEIEDEDMLASIAMIAAATTTTMTLMTSVTKPPDLLIAGAGALALIAGEVMATLGDKTALEAMTAEVTKRSDGKSDQAQIDLLNTQKKSYESAKKTLETKMAFQTAAAYIYYIASAAVIYEIGVCVGIGITTLGTGYAACMTEIHTTHTNDPSIMNKARYGGQRLFADRIPTIPRNDDSFFSKFFSLILSKAEAGLLPLGLGITSAAVTALIVSQSMTLKTTLVIPWVRVVGWAAMGRLCLGAASATKSQMDKIDVNINSIDQVLKEMSELEKGIELNKMTEQQIKLANLQERQTEDLRLNADPKIKSDCLLSEGSENCKSIADTIQAMPSFQNLPDSLKALGTQAAKLGDGLSGTNTVSASTMASANSFARRSGAIKKMKDLTQRKINEVLLKEKKPKMDLEKEQAKLLSKWKANAAKDLKSHNMSPSEFLAAVGASPVSSTAKVLDTIAKKKVEVAAVRGAAPAKAKDDLNFDFKESPKEADTAALAASDAAAYAAKNEELDIGSNDINTDSGLNIFELISNRYLKSGYPKLLEEIPVKKE